MKTKLLIKHAGEVRWRAPNVTAYRDEEELRMLLHDAPDLLPGEDEGRPLVLAREFPVSFGYVDLVGVTAGGAIVLIECKLRANAEIRRTIVGQLLAYAAALWQTSYEEFDAGWRQSGQPPLLQEVASALADVGQTMESDRFVEAVSANLQAGRFRLVVAVDEITVELQRIIEYLSEHTLPEVSVVALELGYVADGDMQILVPEAYGVEMARQKASTIQARGTWDAASVIGKLREEPGEWAEPIARQLFDWADNLGLEGWYGTGAKQGSAHFGLHDSTGRRRPLFSIYAPSKDLTIGFGGIEFLPPFDDPAVKREALARLNAIEGAQVKDTPWAGLRWEALRPEASRRQLFDTLLWIVESVRSGPAPSSVSAAASGQLPS